MSEEKLIRFHYVNSAFDETKILQTNSRWSTVSRQRASFGYIFYNPIQKQLNTRLPINVEQNCGTVNLPYMTLVLLKSMDAFHAPPTQHRNF